MRCEQHDLAVLALARRVEELEQRLPVNPDIAILAEICRTLGVDVAVVCGSDHRPASRRTVIIHLLRIGWTKARVARALGITRQGVQRVCKPSGNRPRLRQSTAGKVLTPPDVQKPVVEPWGRFFKSVENK
jgi:transcriptional regulator with XRE-family HTH domain